MNAYNEQTNKKTLFVEVDVDNNSYYFDGCHYEINFPLHYAVSHLEETGPKECANCKDFGSWRGLFIGYCANCAHMYDYTRGRGFYAYGFEDTIDRGESAFDTYLKDVSLAYIGNYEEGNPQHILDKNGAPINFHDDYQNIIRHLDIRGFILGSGLDPNCLDDDASYALKTGDFRKYFVKSSLNEEEPSDGEYCDLPDLIPCEEDDYRTPDDWSSYLLQKINNIAKRPSFVTEPQYEEVN
jgi:hypothetical protein